MCIRDRIIIVGDGKVGYTLAEHLSQEEHDVTLIDTDDEALKRASDALDVMCVKGNGASIDVYKRQDRSWPAPYIHIRPGPSDPLPDFHPASQRSLL